MYFRMPTNKDFVCRYCRDTIHPCTVLKVTFILFHRRNLKFRHNYGYYKDDLKLWIDKGE
jgi:hypothetical protein